MQLRERRATSALSKPAWQMKVNLKANKAERKSPDVDFRNPPSWILSRRVGGRNAHQKPKVRLGIR
jgi:hypothetical protein